MRRQTTIFRAAVACVPLLAAFLGCSLFELGDNDSSDESGTSEAESAEGEAGETGDVPEVGLRVYPKYMQVDVQAIVTLDVNTIPTSCPPDDDDGGYLCDISGLASDTALVRVEREGFVTALVQPSIMQGVIQSVDVTLEPAG